MKFLKPNSLFELVKRSGENSRLLALHISPDTVGVAVSNVGNTIGEPLTSLDRKKGIQFIGNHLKLLIPKYSVKGIVTAYPITRDGGNTPSPLAMQVKNFMDDLDKTGELGDLSYTFQEFDPAELRERLLRRSARMLQDVNNQEQN